MKISVELLGQSGIKFRFSDAVVYVDPYLSDSVAELDSADLRRLTPIPFLPESVNDADWVLLTHEHIDHCDPQTIPKLSNASPQAHFIAPQPVVDILKDWGIHDSRIHRAEESWRNISSMLRVRAIPAAHPKITRDKNNNLKAVGYLLDVQGKRIYIAGDTFIHEDILDTLIKECPIHTAFLPVNEHNFFRARRGIIGNLSVHEAFQFAEEMGVQQLVPVHWDMFAANAVDPEEIRFIHKRKNPPFQLCFQPKLLNLADVRISIVIRTLNECRYLDDLLGVIAGQQISGLGYEVIIVDSGSTDETLAIAERHGCRVLHITRDEFSFGRSLNMGCEAANGDVLVFISGHCVPTSADWLENLCKPLLEGTASYTYGRQVGDENSHFSERKIFAKYFPDEPDNGQDEFFCNNANAAINHNEWRQLRFDEELTGLEDMELAQRLIKRGGKILYVPNAVVFHHHKESWPQVQRRFEREAIALQKIMPQVHISFIDAIRYTIVSTLADWRSAIASGDFIRNWADILRYRSHQYFGAYIGNNQHRRLSHADKEKYFYPS